MSASSEFTEYVLELLEPIGSIRIGRFFGGIGFSCNSVQFAMMMNDSLYFVVDDTTRDKYEQAGMSPFSYLTKKGRVQVRRYFEVPADVLDDPDQLQCWARESVSIAAAGSAKKAKRRHSA